MQSYSWLIWLFLAGVALKQLAAILYSLQSTQAMLKRLLGHHGIQWEVPVEPSAHVKELASNPDNEIAAIKAYREQTGLGLKEARVVVDQWRPK